MREEKEERARKKGAGKGAVINAFVPKAYDAVLKDEKIITHFNSSQIPDLDQIDFQLPDLTTP